MTALAVLVALVGAMFVALQSASAAGACRESGGVITLGFGQTCDIAQAGADTVAVAGEEPDGAVEAGFGTTTANTDGAVVTISAAQVGGEDVATTTAATVTITEYGNDDAADPSPLPADHAAADRDTETTYTVVVEGLGIAKVEIVGDSDNLVKAGPQVTARVTVRSPNDAAQVQLTIPSTGLSIHDDAGTPSLTDDRSTQSRIVDLGNLGDDTGDAATDGVVTQDFVVNTAGAPAGEYTLTFTVDDNGFATDNAEGQVANPSEPLVLKIGDVGEGIGSATLALGNSKDDLPFTADDETVAETGTAAAKGGKINLVVIVLASNGEKANASDIDQIIVFARGGKIESTHNNGNTAEEDIAGGNNAATFSEGTGEGAADLGNTLKFSVAKVDEKPGSVTVTAFVTGPGGGRAETGEVELTFSGSAGSITVSDATESLLSVNPEGEDDDTIMLQVTAEDASGNEADPPTVGVTITITGPDDKRVNANKIAFTQPTKDGTKFYITLTGKGTKAAPLAGGEYTVNVKKGDLEDSATFSVAGAAAQIELEVDIATPGANDTFVTATAKVTDKDGNNVSDGTMVTFGASGKDEVLDLVGDAMKSTKDGVATATFVVVGEGRSVISAVSGEGRDATAVTPDFTVVDAPETEEEEAAPEPDPEPAAATLASASASVSADSANVGDSVDVTITATDSADATADDSLVAAVIVTANGTLVSADAVGSQTVSVSCDEPGSIEISVRLVGTDTMVHEASASVTCLGDATAITL
ncbi:MAG: hypothetical protein OXC29_18835, partial [Rhodococcus sp.]|nr:hypothetical protein [Rhodococcus sp. (in: high G+C Gram-positive bacteria)]